MKIFAIFGLFLFPVFGCFAQQSWQKVSETLLFNNPPFKECHASTLVETAPGTIMAAWFAGKEEGHKEVCIWAATLQDGKWSKPFKIADGRVDKKLSFALWNPVLFKSKAGKVFLFYKEGINPREWWGMVKTSVDNGETWSDAVRLPDGVLGPIKNKPIELTDGTFLSPSSTESLDDLWKVHIERSVDQGKSWEIIPVNHDSTFGVIQPSILVYPDNKLQLLSRSKQGHIIQSWSEDNGKTWSALSPIHLLNPNSGIDAVTLKDGVQLLVYNPTLPGKDWSNGRQKLNVAISKNGVKWTDIAILEDSKIKKEFSYPAVIQTNDGKVHITYTYDRKNIKHVVLENK